MAVHDVPKRKPRQDARPKEAWPRNLSTSLARHHFPQRVQPRREAEEAFMLADLQSGEGIILYGVPISSPSRENLQPWTSQGKPIESLLYHGACGEDTGKAYFPGRSFCKFDWSA